MVEGLVGLFSGLRVVFSHSDGGLGWLGGWLVSVLVRGWFLATVRRLVRSSVGPSPLAFLAFTDGFCITAPAKMLGLAFCRPCPPLRDLGCRVHGLICIFSIYLTELVGTWQVQNIMKTSCVLTDQLTNLLTDGRTDGLKIGC